MSISETSPRRGVAAVNGNRSSAQATPDSAALLDARTFAIVVGNAPLIAIDLIVEDAQSAILLGLRNNPPAKGNWFVPGGRVRKNETLNNAFARITQNELGVQSTLSQSKIVGIYEHFYDTNFNGVAGASSHYVVLAYRLRMAPDTLHLPTGQHSQYIWMAPDRMTQFANIHPYTQAYFPKRRDDA